MKRLTYSHLDCELVNPLPSFSSLSVARDPIRLGMNAKKDLLMRMPVMAIFKVCWTIYFHSIHIFESQISMDNDFAWMELHGKVGVLWHVYDTPSNEKRRLGEVVRPVGAASVYFEIFISKDPE